MANNKYYGVRLGAIESGSSFTGLSPTMSLVWALVTGTTLPGVSVTEVAQNPGFYYFQYGATSPVMFRIDFGAGLANSFRYVEGVLDPVQSVDQSLANQGTTLTAAGVTLSAIGITVAAVGTTLTAQGSTITAIGSTVTQIGINVSGIGSTLTAQGSTITAIGSTVTQIGTNVSGIGTTLIAQGSTMVGIGTTLTAIGSSLGGIGSTITQFAAYLGSTASSFGSTSTDPATIFGYLKRVQENLEGNSTFTKATGVFDIYSRGSSTLLIEKTITQSTVNVTKT